MLVPMLVSMLAPMLVPMLGLEVAFAKRFQTLTNDSAGHQTFGRSLKASVLNRVAIPVKSISPS